MEAAYSEGWTRMKLYFLTGLPTETDEDTLGIAELARRCVALGKRHTNRASVTVSVGGFVPKPHTPFQWFGQNTVAELRRKVQLLRDASAKARGVQLKWHDPAASLAEGLASRGDRRIGRVIERVWRGGGTFQEWSEHFDLRRWEEAMAAEGLSMDWYVARHRTEDEVLPWDHISAGLHKDFLWQDWKDALAEHGVEDCRWTPCYDCGVCTGYGLEHVVASPVPPAGGSQGTGQDLSRGHEVPVQLTARPVPVGVRRERGSGRRRVPRSATPSRARSAGPATATRHGSGSGRCGEPASPSPTPRASRPAHGSTSAWPCRRATSRSASSSTSTWPVAATARTERTVRSTRPACRHGSRRRCRSASP